MGKDETMSIISLLFIGVGLAMDAFAVSVCRGLSMKKMNVKQAIIIGLYFGGFQALMPFIGYLLGVRFEAYIKNFDHWIAFGLLLMIGANMIKEALSQEEEESVKNDSVGFKDMIMLAIATSIDALAVGVSFAFLSVNIVEAVIVIGITTFVISIAGVKIGHVFGEKYKSKAEIVGGLILIGMGIKILIEHLFF